MPTSESLTVDVQVLPDASCAVCPHPLQDHDPLGVRYCNATTASALPRGCICR
ncbi:RGCVC family protein [Nocardia sp. NRRL S-836]|uniref:RGCVC family protein n=1 Tax=Nocardia sp. NRRL S-836 TaxID=1519492 RepID=UPI000A63B1D8|nr:RGCVC family protein [Nocardia sp. NRRL S-836]